jgi:enediyne biosynthesis thioesterase
MTINQRVAPELVRTVPAPRPRRYSYRHTVSFEETNVVGNVYFTRHLSWQGRCRELFLADHAPDVIDALRGDLRLVTLNVACDYFAELHALDIVEIQMLLAQLRQHRIKLRFDYLLHKHGAASLIARGTQEIGCMRQTESGLVPTAVPPALARALADYQDSVADQTAAPG